jgi:hypothetical protein
LPRIVRRRARGVGGRLSELVRVDKMSHTDLISAGRTPTLLPRHAYSATLTVGSFIAAVIFVLSSTTPNILSLEVQVSCSLCKSSG